MISLKNATLLYKLEGHTQVASLQNGNDDFDVDFVVKEKGKMTSVKVVLKPKKTLTLMSARLSYNYKFDKKDRLFVNGYQTWTDTREFGINEKLNNIYRLPKFLVKMYAFDKYGDIFFKKYRKHILHGYTYGYVKGHDDLVLGSYNDDNSYFIYNFDAKHKQIVLESDIEGLTLDKKFTLFDFVIINDNVEKGLQTYLSKFTPKTKELLTGYSSWYNLYQNISEQSINECLANFDKEHFSLFQIDDGYESKVGDWLTVDPVKFPNGLEPIVKEIKNKDLLAGLWLAPFAAQKDSELVKNHPDWIVKDAKGEMIFCGSNWGGFYALDVENKEVQKYVKSCFAKYNEMGFDLYKLDFLYAAAVKPITNKTRAQLMAQVVKLINEATEGKLILGCGVPLGSAFGKFAYCRIGPDVSLEFDDVWFMRVMHRERISTKISIQNTIYRRHLNGTVFMNDPDVFILRDDRNKLTKKQKESLMIMNALFGGILLSSDNVGEYDEEKLNLYNKALALREGLVIKDVISTKKDITILFKNKDGEQEIVYEINKGEIKSWKNQK